MRKNFLLLNKTAVKLYKSVKNLPVIDYHNHLSIEDIEKDTEYKDIYKLWVKPDPYKHRVMRMCGVPEKYITGEAEDFEKFSKWCETVPKLTGHPLQHWTMMELEVFKVYEMPCKENAEKIYRKCNEFLKKNKLSPSTFFKKFNVEKVCPCMTVTDRLFSSEICVPSLRGDGVADTVKSFGEINSLDDFERALKNRINEFKKSGCRVADHALDNGFSYYKDDGKNNERFLSLLNETITEEDKKKLSSYLLTFMGRQYAKNGFIMQLHIGAQRETSSKLRSAAGKEGGFAAMGNSVNVKSLIEFLEALDESCGLPKTILFTLNPADNALISTISGSFVKDNVKGLITQGPAWWWCDHIKTGDSKRDESIEKVIKMFPIMRELDINCICFNWMAHIGWLRTSDKIIERGGAFVTGYDEKEFNVTDAKISEKELWDNYKYFLDAVIPYAEKYDINLALHPDDPPVKKLGDVSRIMISAENIRKAIYDIHPSQNLGITMCQANYYIMGEDVEKVIKEFAQKILFIHFRNVTGNLHKFNETFHDNGDLPMRKLIKLYKELDINVPIRVDHVPTLKNENTDVAGYGALGRLFAIGYLKGLVENDKSN